MFSDGDDRCEEAATGEQAAYMRLELCHVLGRLGVAEGLLRCAQRLSGQLRSNESLHPDEGTVAVLQLPPPLRTSSAHERSANVSLHCCPYRVVVLKMALSSDEGSSDKGSLAARLESRDPMVELATQGKRCDATSAGQRPAGHALKSRHGAIREAESIPCRIEPLSRQEASNLGLKCDNFGSQLRELAIAS